jgi:hypothetical protein
MKADLRQYLRPKVLLPAIAATLALVHMAGVATVDQFVLALAVIALLPFARELVQTIKAGGVEVAFRDLTISDQVYVFLEAVTEKRAWTFYQPRPGEQDLGAAFKLLVEDLLTRDRDKALRKLRQWLAADEENQRWFAAEVIGHFKIAELRHRVVQVVDAMNPEVTSAPWQLNCLWAASRFETDYLRLREFFLRTKSASDQAWIIRSFNQMICAGEGTPLMFEKTLGVYEARFESHTPPPSIESTFEDCKELRRGQHTPAELSERRTTLGSI